MNNEFGPVYEIVGFSALSTSDASNFENAFITFFLPKGAVPGSLGKGAWLGVFVDRHGEYPDLMLELSQDGRLLVCDMNVHKVDLVSHLRKFLMSYPKVATIPMLSLNRILDAANGGPVSSIDDS